MDIRAGLLVLLWISIQVTQATLPAAFYNECHFDDPHYNSLYDQCCAIPDPTKRVDLMREMQMIDWTTNGYMSVLPTRDRGICSACAWSDRR